MPRAKSRVRASSIRVSEPGRRFPFNENGDLADGAVKLMTRDSFGSYASLPLDPEFREASRSLEGLPLQSPAGHHFASGLVEHLALVKHGLAFKRC